MKSSWQYWKTPVLFGAGICILQIVVAIVRFGGRGNWDPPARRPVGKLAGNR